MIYDLKNKDHINLLKQRLNEFASMGYMVELKKYHPKRSLKQNSYLHLLFQIVAIEMGESLEYVKQELFKKIVNAEIFREVTQTKSGSPKVLWRSSADLDKAEMVKAIDRFKDFCAKELNVYLPDANSPEQIQRAQIEVKNNDRYLM